MNSIRTKITILTVCTIIAAISIATVIGLISIQKLGRNDADRMLHLTVSSGAMSLESYFESVEHSVETVSTFVQGGFDDMLFTDLEDQVERIRNLFEIIANNTNGVLTYYFRIDPEVSDTVKGFWYVKEPGTGFQEHEVTDISRYDTNDTSQLVWFTVPKATGKGVWLSPYNTENLGALVISYNVPVYRNDRFIGVIGIEIDYDILAPEVENIRIFDSGYAFILDEDSNVFYHPQIGNSKQLNLEATALSDAERSIGSNHVRYNYEGVEKEAVWIPLSNGMRLYVAAPVSEIDSGWKKMIKNILLAALVILAVSCMVTLRFSSRLTKPLKDLTKVAEQIEEGNYEYTLDYSGNDEIGILTQTFKRVASNVKTYVTDLDDLTKQLMIQKETLSALLDNMPAINFSKDAETGVYLYCNQGFAVFAGKKTPSAVIGLKDDDIFDSVTAKHFAEDDAKALSMDEPHIFFEDVVDADGKRRQFQSTKLKFTDSSGRLCLLGMSADVTDLRTQAQADSMITAMASDYRCVYYINLDENDAVCYRDDPADPNQIPVGVHFPYLERITAYAENCVTESYREGFLDFIRPENIRTRLATQPIIAYRYLARRRDREYYEMIRAAGVRRAEERDDQTVHAIGLGFTEIDEEMRDTMAKNEALAQALSIAEDASKAKTSFLSNMSHEIRTPMNAIIGLDTLALNDDSVSPKTREYLEKIGSSAHHLLDLINDILDMSRIESGRIVLRKEKFSFRAILEQINTMVMSQCGDKGLSYECRLLSRVDDYYIGDDTKLKEILINILSNAIKFTEAPGSVIMTVERTAVFGDQSTLHFCIKDTGIGMDKEFIPKIFDPFSQEDSTTKSKYGSTGLGMAITKRIVEMMNGTIMVESEKGKGSTFTVVITLKNADHKAADTEDAVDPGRMHILVVDDDEIAAEHARKILEEAGIRADVCHSGAEALRMMEVQHTKHEPYNLVLMDWKMPGMDGLKTAEEIRKLYDSETTVVIITAYNWDDIEEEAHRIGVDSFMSKPLFASSVVEEFAHIAMRNNMDLFKEKKRAGLKGRKILIAEDQEMNADILIDILEIEDIEADHAENGLVALDMFKNSDRYHYDAILMDIRMPEMDGLESTEAIRALDRPDAKRIPIIALTANAFDEDVQRSLQAGMNAHLTKPVDPDNLYRTLGELIYEAEKKA